MSLRIAMLTTYFCPPHVHGGVDTVAIELKKRLEANGCEVHVFVPAFRGNAALDAASTAAGTTRLPCPKWPLLYNFVFARKLRPLIAAGRFDAVINLQSLLGWKLDFHPHIAVVPTTAIGEAQSMRITGPLKLLNYLARKTLGYRCERRVFHQCDRIVAVGEHIAEDIHRQYGLPRERIVSIGNGIDCEQYSPSSEPAPPRQGPPVVLYVGRLVSRKNVELLIQAAGVLAGRGADFAVEMAGEGDRRGALESLARQLGVQDRVRFLGRVPLNELLPVYRRSSVMVVPSRYESLGPLVLLEAQACGLPAVVANYPSADRIVDHGRTGFVMRQNTPEELANYVERLLADENLARNMGRQGRQRMLDVFSWQRVVEQYLALVESCRNEIHG